MTSIVPMGMILGIVGGVIAVGLLVAFIWWWRSTADDPRQVADEKIPVRRFAQGCMFILTRSQDYGYFTPESPRETLGGSWEIHDGAEATRRIENLLGTQATDAEGIAFDLVRAINVSRMAAGALYLTQEQSWEQVARACHKLQASFNSFEEIGKAYEHSAAQWYAEQGEQYDGYIEDNMKYLREFVWSEIDFKRPL